MLLPRLIPVLLIHNSGLVKTTRFSEPKYVGDPINAVRIFNEKEVDELVVADIDATVQNREPDYELIAKLAAECRMPLCYSGGVRRADQFERLVSLGVEKVAISSAAVQTPELITEAAQRVGSQSVVVVMDVKRTGILKRYELCTHNGTVRTGQHPGNFARTAESLGAGEIVVNSIDADGERSGYDHALISEVRSEVSLPVTALGGAGSLDDVEKLVRKFGIIGAAAGSMFVFKGKFRAVLIQYPTRDQKEELFTRCFRTREPASDAEAAR